MTKVNKDKVKTCGLIMPISAIGGYDEEHWKEVRECIEDIVNEMGFETRMVSDSDLNLLIPSSIVQSLIQDDIVICDISGCNPNVMFELGLRIGFNKSYIIIFDEKQNIPFDINTIPCIKYPSTLNKVKLKKFEKELKDRVEKVISEEGNDFLKAYGKIKIYEAEEEKVEGTIVQEEILEKIDFIVKEITKLNYEIKIIKNGRSDRDFPESRNFGLSGRELEKFIKGNQYMLRMIQEMPFHDFFDRTAEIIESRFPGRPRGMLEAATALVYKRIKNYLNIGSNIGLE